MFVPVSQWLYVITGFTQTRATRSRLVELWKELYDRYVEPHVIVALRAWNTDWKAEAEHVLRLAPDQQEEITIKVFAYSWGAGWGLVRFARALGARGLRVQTAVLSDPVYRHPYWLGQWRTLLSRWPIVIPANVGEVYSYYQRQNWPRGHKLVAAGKDTVLQHPIQLQATHDAMDEQPQFLTRCRLEAGKPVYPLTIVPGDFQCEEC